MSSYVDLTLSEYQFTRVIDLLEMATEKSHDYCEIEDNVCLIQFLQEEYDSDKSKQNEEFERWRKQQSLKVKGEKPNPQLFHKIRDVLKKNGVEFEYDDEFYCICDLIDLFSSETER